MLLLLLIFYEFVLLLIVVEIYSTLGNNGILTTSPMVLHFAGFEVGKVRRLKLDIINSSADVQRMHILPPQTNYFRILYTKNVSKLQFVN